MIFGGVIEISGWPVFLNFNVFPDFEIQRANIGSQIDAHLRSHIDAHIQNLKAGTPTMY